MVGFQGIFFYQLKKVCDIDKSEENCPCICCWQRAHVSHMYERKKKKLSNLYFQFLLASNGLLKSDRQKRDIITHEST